MLVRFMFFGNPEGFYRDPGVYVGFGEYGGVVRVFYSTIFQTVLFVIEGDEGKRFVKRHEEEIAEFVESRKREPGPVSGPFTCYLLDEDWVVDFLNRYIRYVREHINPDAVLGADKPTPQGTIHIGLTEVK